jgi:hypothetical protein
MPERAFTVQERAKVSELVSSCIEKKFDRGGEFGFGTGDFETGRITG